MQFESLKWKALQTGFDPWDLNRQEVFMRLYSVIEILALTCFLGFWLREKRKLQRQVALLNNRQCHLESVTSGFMKECEKTLSEVSIRITQMDLVPIPLSWMQTSMPMVSQELKNLALDTGRSSCKGTVKITSRPELAGSRVASKDVRETILSLNRKGATPQDIASRLGLPLGEIELILNLRATTTHSKKVKTASLSC